MMSTDPLSLFRYTDRSWWDIKQPDIFNLLLHTFLRSANLKFMVQIRSAFFDDRPTLGTVIIQAKPSEILKVGTLGKQFCADSDKKCISLVNKFTGVSFSKCPLRSVIDVALLPRLGTSPEKTSLARKCSVPGAEFAYSKSENNTRYLVLTHFT